jgi:hypothetical protein
MWPQLPEGHDLTPKVEQEAPKNPLCVGIAHSMDERIRYRVLSVKCLYVRK